MVDYIYFLYYPKRKKNFDKRKKKKIYVRRKKGNHKTKKPKGKKRTKMYFFGRFFCFIRFFWVGWLVGGKGGVYLLPFLV